MSDMIIGLNGLDVAQRAIEVIGNNIANASTEGYHRQEAAIVPVAGTKATALAIGGGAEVRGVDRIIDQLLERALRGQMPEMGQVDQELETLATVENLLGDLSVDGLTGAMGRFFTALQGLSVQPDSDALREEVVWSGDALAAQFQAVGASLDTLGSNILIQARQVADDLNNLTEKIADLNDQIQGLNVRGVADSNLQDLRDQAVLELSRLAEVDVAPGENGTYTIQVFGTVAVLRGTHTPIEVDHCGDEMIGVSAGDAHYYDDSVRGGKLGGLLALKNDLLPIVSDRLDTLAFEMIRRVNAVHVQGIGTDGSFTSIDGLPSPDGVLADWPLPVEAGTLTVRLTSKATGAVTRVGVAVDPATQTLADVAAALDALPGLSAGVRDTRLHVEANAGYVFDFLPGVVLTDNLTGSSSPTLEGLYEAESNETFTCTVRGTGTVGVTDGLEIEVRNVGGELVRTLAVGLGYPAGDRLDVADGIQVTMSMGALIDGETFTLEAVANSDPTGLLAAAGVNTFFAGASARTMSVVASLRNDSGGLATTRGAGDVDNFNVLRMAALSDEPIETLDDATFEDAHRRIVSTVGQWVGIRRGRQEAIRGVVEQLFNQREDISGVDVNAEAARLLVFERMFQGIAKYLSAVERTRSYLLEIV